MDVTSLRALLIAILEVGYGSKNSSGISTTSIKKADSIINLCISQSKDTTQSDGE